jgi:isocitrate lyase
MADTAGTIRTHRGLLILKMRIVEGEATRALQRMQQTVSSLHKKFGCLAGWKKRMVKRRRSLLAAHKNPSIYVGGWQHGLHSTPNYP